MIRAEAGVAIANFSMGAVFEEFRLQLQAWDKQYAGRPRDHLIRLCLLALEREEIVTVAYREAHIAARLAGMPLPESARQTIQHALMWAWKDEEMHAIYIRGAIFRLGSRRLRTAALAKQVAGAIGGWSSAVIHHLRWRDAPVSRALASTLAIFGSLTGQVPEDVKKSLNYGSFRDFCLFNVDAERTASACWKRMAEIAERVPELPTQTREDFRRVQQDEDNHERIFTIIAEVLDASDNLRAGESAYTLTERISEVGDFFLPGSERALNNPLGQGGRVGVTEVPAESDKGRGFREFLQTSDLSRLLEKRAHDLGKTGEGLKVAVKTAFMLGYHRADRSPLTDPDLVDELAKFLREHGCSDVAVGEGRNLYDCFYSNRTVCQVASYFHIHSPYYRLVDFTEEQVPHVYARGLGQSTVAKTWRDADFRISFGKMRSHPVEMVYLTLGNLEGVGTRCDEFLFPERQAHRDTAIMMLLSDFPPDYALLDAFEHAADRILGMLASPRPLHPRRFYGGVDALAVDMVAASHVGLLQPRKSNFLRAAIQWFGDPSQGTEVVGCKGPIREWRGPYHSELSSLLSLLAYPVYQFGSGRGSLFLPEMDEGAFPPLHRARLLTRFSRSSLRRLLGFRRPR